MNHKIMKFNFKKWMHDHSASTFSSAASMPALYEQLDGKDIIFGSKSFTYIVVGRQRLVVEKDWCI